MNKICLVLLLILSISTSYSRNSIQLKSGAWSGELKIRTNITLPVNIEILHSKTGLTFTVINGKEKIKLGEHTIIGDSCHVPFSLFNTVLIFKKNSSTQINGRWVNLNKQNYSIPFSASFSKISKKNKKQENHRSNQENIDFSGKWEVVFSENKEKPYPAIGLFEQNKSTISGTFLTETGDYRFLHGQVNGKSFYLSSFDGTHAFLFNGTIDSSGKIDGLFYSGSHYETNWSAHKNEQFELNHPDSITYVKDTTAEVTFKLKDIHNNDFNYPNDQTKNKVVIIQIMGTWCSNCYDETVYFKKLYDQYHSQGLEIISIAYEMGKEFNDYAKRVQLYKDKLKIDYTLLIGGNAQKQLCHELFPFLNSIVSFPTAIFIDKQGEIQRIHTGFSGPGTGSYYTEYMDSTEKLLKELLK